MKDWTGQQFSNYTVTHLLEKGRVIDRYLCVDMCSQRQVTLHLLAEQTDETRIQRFLNYVPAVERLFHPHIAPLLDAGAQERTPFLVRDYLPTSRQFHQFPLPISTVVRLVAQLAEAFDYAHRQHLLCTYTTPETILIGSRGEALLGGFGLQLLEASLYSRDQRSWMHLVSPVYLSPEQVGGYCRSPSTDQYTLAVVVYEWLCGVPPFRDATPADLAWQHLQVPPPSLREMIPTIPQELEQVIEKALAKWPEERFDSIKEFSTALLEASQQTLDSLLTA